MFSFTDVQQQHRATSELFQTQVPAVFRERAVLSLLLILAKLLASPCSHFSAQAVQLPFSVQEE